jgi:hypothetical protein
MEISVIVNNAHAQYLAKRFTHYIKQHKKTVINMLSYYNVPSARHTIVCRELNAMTTRLSTQLSHHNEEKKVDDVRKNLEIKIIFLFFFSGQHFDCFCFSPPSKKGKKLLSTLSKMFSASVLTYIFWTRAEEQQLV